MCLEAGKQTVCEKAVVMNVVDEEGTSKWLVVNAMPLNKASAAIVVCLRVYQRYAIGVTHRYIANTRTVMDPGKSFSSSTHRMNNPDMAGGALLDLAAYSLSWYFQFVLK